MIIYFTCCWIFWMRRRLIWCCNQNFIHADIFSVYCVLILAVSWHSWCRCCIVAFKYDGMVCTLLILLPVLVVYRKQGYLLLTIFLGSLTLPSLVWLPPMFSSVSKQGVTYTCLPWRKLSMFTCLRLSFPLPCRLSFQPSLVWRSRSLQRTLYL